MNHSNQLIFHQQCPFDQLFHPRILAPRFPSVPVPTPNPGHLYSVVQIPESCSLCIGNAMENIRNMPRIQVPINMIIPTGNTFAVNPIHGVTPSAPRRPSGNQVLANPLAPYNYLPPPPRVGARTKSGGDTGRIKVMGLSKWYWKRRTEQLLAKSISKNKLQRNHKILKRLNNNLIRRDWKIQRRNALSEREFIREAKLEMLRQRRGINKSPNKTECTLWNCPRKEYRRDRPLMQRLVHRSLSRLSNLSTKSRSPIVFRRSP